MLGGKSAMVGRLGDDDHGGAYRANFAERGVDDQHVGTEPDCSSGVAAIVVDETSGENQIIVVKGANDRLTAEHVHKATDAFEGAGVVVGGLEVPFEAAEAALRLGKAANATTILNAAPLFPNDDLNALLAVTDVLVVNESEAAALAGTVVNSAKEAEAACPALLQRVPRVVITLGAEGAVLAGRDDPKPVRVTAPATSKVVDTTGAGDAFVGALAFFVGNRSDLKDEEKVRRACAVATASVGRQGTQSSYLAREELPAELFR